MTHLKSYLFWGKITGLIGVALSIFAQIITCINLASGNYTANLKTSLVIMTIVSFVFLITSLIGFVLLLQNKLKRAGTILLLSGLASLIFVYIFAGAALIISGLLVKVSTSERK